MAVRPLAPWAVVALVLLAGCASKETPASTGPSVSGGSVGGGSGASSAVVPDNPPPPPISGTSARWHFHDYWHGKPTIVLLDEHVNLSPSVAGLSALVDFPQGVIVPPETGFLTVNLTWPDPAGGFVNLTYKPADANDYFPIKDAASGKAVVIPTTESMCDVPHRQKSLWMLNLTAKPDANLPPGLPSTDVRIIVTATIGRPLFIDPPHFNWWGDATVIDLVRTTQGSLATGVTPAGNATLPDPTTLTGLGVPPAQDRVATTVESANKSATVPATPGRIVPEGAESLVAILNWTADAPSMPKLKLVFEEQNDPASGPMTVAVDGTSSRIFTMPVLPPQTDTTYSNRTTWQFHILPEGDSAAAFKGSYVLTVWVTRLAPGEALAAVQAPPKG